MDNIKLVVTKYNRIAVTGIRELTYEPRRRLQLILGSNGSGKSSVMSELIPSLPNVKQFQKGGSKELSFDLDGRHYRIGFTSDKGIKHFFDIDGAPQNEVGTTTVQKDLLLRELGIDSNIHALLSDREHFTGMSGAKRREWLTRLCEVRYDYALSVYVKLKEHLNNTMGAAKRTKARLVTEQAKLITPEEQLNLEQTHKQLQSDIDQLNAMRERVDRDTVAIDREWTELDEYLVVVTKRLNAQVKELDRLNPTGDSRACADLAEQLRADIQVSEARLSDLYRHYEEDNKTLELLQRAGDADLEHVKLSIKTHTDALTDISRRLPLAIGEGFKDFASAARSVHEPLTTLLMQIPSNADSQYSLEALQRHTAERDRLYKEHQQTVEKIASLTGLVKHLENHVKENRIGCPKCKHTWTPGGEPQNLEDVKKQLAEAQQHAADLLVSCKVEQAACDDQEAYKALVVQYRQIARSTPGLSVFWVFIESQDLLKTYPKRVLDEFIKIYSNLSLYEDYDNHQTEIARLSALYADLEKAGGTTLKAISETVARREAAIARETNICNQLKRQIQGLDDVNRRFKQIAETSSELEQLVARHDVLSREFIQAACNELIQRELAELMAALTDNTRSLNELSTRQALIQDLEKEVEYLRVEELAAKALVEELSPTKGLIAEGLLGFIRIYIKQMNSFIKNVWAYPLVIQECNVSNDETAELDYKFPVLVGEQAIRVNDVSEGSTGICEIIDLAFRVTAMRYLKMDRWPLILDEFGSSLDIKHREQAIQTIKRILSSAAFNQVFMVSHYPDVYGALDNPEILVTCPNNIVIPDCPYNQHATLVY